MGQTKLTITGGYFYTDSNYPASIDIDGTSCDVIDYQLNNGYDSTLVCQTAPKPTTSSQTEFYGGLGVTLIRDNFYSSDLTNAVPSANAIYSQLIDAQYDQYNDNTTTSNSDITVWLKGFFKPGKTANYQFSITSFSSAILYLSTDETAANKVCYLLKLK